MFGLGAVAVLGMNVPACGYRALYGIAANERMHVALVHVGAVSGAVGEEVARGASEELAKQGALAGGEGFPRLEIDVGGGGETSDGIAVGRSGALRARATDVALAGRAWVADGPSGVHRSDTGEVRVENIVSAGSADALTASLAYEDAMRAAGRNLGHLLASRALGDPASGAGLVGR